MAISLTFKEVERKFNSKYWKDIEAFEEYYLKYLSETKSDRIYYTKRDGEEQIINAVNHHLDLKEYEVWSEGYSATGESNEAHLWGKVEARNFAEACHKIFCQHYLDNIKTEEKNPKAQYGMGRWDYDPHSLTYWGCGLFWSEELSRKTFG